MLGCCCSDSIEAMMCRVNLSGVCCAVVIMNLKGDVTSNYAESVIEIRDLVQGMLVGER